jgi:hypothetical protein
MAGCCEYSNQLLGSIKGRISPDLLSILLASLGLYSTELLKMVQKNYEMSDTYISFYAHFFKQFTDITNVI